MPNENPYRGRVPDRDRGRVNDRRRQKRRKVAKDGAERGAATGPIVGIIVALAVQYGLPAETGAFLTEPATIAAFTAILVWLARIAEALIADASEPDIE